MSKKSKSVSHMDESADAHGTAECSWRYTKADLIRLSWEMDRVASATYAMFFAANMGGRIHAFIEFNGLISKYCDLAREAAHAGLDFTVASVHSAEPWPVKDHDLEYLGEKLACIFAPFIRANPRAREILSRHLFDD